MSVTDVAFAAGFGSLRQFNDVMRAEYGASPTELRRRPVAPDRPADGGSIAVRLPVTVPWDGERLLHFLGSRAIACVEQFTDGQYRRSVATAAGDAVVGLSAAEDALHVQIAASDVGVVGPVMSTVRRLCDLAADIAVIDAALASHRRFAPMVRRRPGLRVPGAVSGWEVLVRAIVGQQVSVAAARTLLGRIVERCGSDASVASDGGVQRVFPKAGDVAAADLEGLGLTGRRALTLAGGGGCCGVR